MSTGRRAWGFSFEFVTDDADLARVLEHCFGDLPRSTGPSARFEVKQRVVDRDTSAYDITLHGPGDSVASCGSGIEPSRVMTLLAWEINGRARASMAHGTVVHAAVVGGPKGAVMVCGDSGSGKSTLAAAASMQGWTHLSDDLALLQVPPTGVVTVCPYARPLMLRARGRQLLNVVGMVSGLQRFYGDEVFVPASALGARVVGDPLPLMGCVFLDLSGNAVGPISRADTLYRLTLHSATLRERGAAGFGDLREVAETVPGFTLQRDDPDRMLSVLAPLVGRQ